MESNKVESNSNNRSEDISKKIHYRHLMLFYFRKGKRVGQTTKKICSVYGDGAVGERTVRKWFSKFKAGKFSLEDQERSGRPATADDEKIKALLYENPRYTTRELAQIMGLSKSTIHEHMSKFGYGNRHDVWVPRNLDKLTMADRRSICATLCRRQEMEPFLHRLVVGGEKWISFDNQVRTKKTGGGRKRAVDEPSSVQTQQNANCVQGAAETSNNNNNTPNGQHQQPKKALLSVWWDFKGLLYWELIEDQQQLTPEKYCSQLDTIRCHLKQKRPELFVKNESGLSGLIYHHDNARPHISEMTKEKLQKQFQWEVLPHPPYSPDIAPSDFHVFRSLQNSLFGKQFTCLEEIQHHVQSFFAERPLKFWENGIMQLPNRWKKVIERNGAYVK